MWISGKKMPGIQRIVIVLCFVLACSAQLVLEGDAEESDEGQGQPQRRVATDPMTRMLQWGVENSDLSDFAQRAQLIRKFLAHDEPCLFPAPPFAIIDVPQHTFAWTFELFIAVSKVVVPCVDFRFDPRTNAGEGKMQPPPVDREAMDLLFGDKVAANSSQKYEHAYERMQTCAH